MTRVMGDGTEPPKGSSADPISVSITNARQLVGPWCQTNIPASQAAAQQGLGANAASQVDMAMVRAGFLTGISASFTVAPAGSTLTISVYKNGVLMDATAVMAVAPGAALGRQVTFTPSSAVLAYAAGDRLGVAITTDGSWTATTSDVAVMLEVQAA